MLANNSEIREFSPARWLKIAVLGFIAFLMLLGLFSYDPLDAVLMDGGRDGVYHNLAGFAGAVFGRNLLLFCGMGSYLLVWLVVLHWIRMFMPGKCGGKAFWLGVLLFVGGVMTFLAFAPEHFAGTCEKLNIGRKGEPASALAGGIIFQYLFGPAGSNCDAGVLRQLLGQGGVLGLGGAMTLCGLFFIIIGDVVSLPLRNWFGKESAVSAKVSDLRSRIREIRENDDEDEAAEKILPPPSNHRVEYDDYPEIVEIPAVSQRDTAVAEPEVAPEKVSGTPSAVSRTAPAGNGVATNVVAAGEKVKAGGREYILPPVTMLAKGVDASGEDINYILQMKERLQQTLDEFSVAGKVTKYITGPRVTRFEIVLDPGVSTRKVENIEDNIKMNLSAVSVRILAPIPGRPAVGVEIPNRKPEAVFMRSVMESDTWRNGSAEIPLVLGKDLSGNPVVMDLAKAPHLLVAGATGTGKSVCTNSLIISLLFRFRPDELKLIMVDPKIVEFEDYSRLPHLITPVVNDSAKVPVALRWAVNEMEKRYRMLAKAGVKKLVEYNRQPDVNICKEDENGMPLPAKMPYLVIIVDELADLMMTEAKKDVETSIMRITQKGRAAGIHVIVATQRPSTNIITGVMKANLPTRLCFQVRSGVDSRVVIDEIGAEKLLGSGDMLYMSPSSMNIERIQGAWTQDADIRSIVKFVSDQAEQEFDDAVVREEDPEGGSADDFFDDDDDPIVGNVDIAPVIRKYMKATDDDIMRQALEVVIVDRQISTSYLQRRLKIGYNKAAGIIDELQARGVVGGASGSGNKREILILDDLMALDNMEN